MTLGSFLSSVSPVGEKRGGGVAVGDKPESSCAKTYVSFRVSHRAWNKQHLDLSHQPAAPEVGLLMDSSSTKQRCTLFYGSKDDGPFVGQESRHVPPGLENLFPPTSAPSWPTSRAVRSWAAWNLSVRVTGVQRDRTHNPGPLQRNGNLGSFSIPSGQAWIAGDGR